jgi:hypothetical protein
MGAALMRRAPGVLLRPGRTLRVALHPDDLLRPGLREATLAGIESALGAGAIALTYQSLLAAGAVRAVREDPLDACSFDLECGAEALPSAPPSP